MNHDLRNRLVVVATSAVRVLAHLLYTPSRWRLAMRRNPSRKLQIGSGKNRFPGWINSDIDPRSEVIVLLERRLPFGDRSLDRIYLEHVLEHVSYDTALSFLKETRRVLAPAGIVRIAVPDLEDLARGYLSDDWKRRFDWVNWPEFAFIRTRAEMINIAFRWWGHTHLYDRQEMSRVLSDAGYSAIEFVERGRSRHQDLCNLETRLDSTLVVEATNT